MFSQIRKRDGRVVKFDPEKITSAIAKAGAATEEYDSGTARRLTIKVLTLAEQLLGDRILRRRNPGHRRGDPASVSIP
jgi:ribonucleoside-triphosphate reductase